MPPHSHKYHTYTGDTSGTIYQHNGWWKQNNPIESTESTGGGAPHENRPKFYAIGYIMKL